MKKIISALLLISMLLCLCACGAETEVGSDAESSLAESSNTAESQAVSEESVESQVEETQFKVTVVDQNGNPVSGVVLQVCKDSCIPMRTDDNGIALFNTEITAEHKLSVLGCPDGYEYKGEAEIYLSDGMTEYSLELEKQMKDE